MQTKKADGLRGDLRALKSTMQQDKNKAKQQQKKTLTRVGYLD